ncbi:MAG: hypothetical protein IJ064_03430 [Bacteroidaceae bacterium]|nr:hypothetical protein [Bacteroidaceae bacterium]
MTKMKSCTSVVLMLCTMFFMGSCDSNKGKSKELAEQFMVALNDGDKAGIYDLYPTAKAYANLEMVTEMATGDLKVEKDKETGLYTVSIENTRQQKLVFKADSLGQLSIVDSYGVLLLTSQCSELALQTGVPIKKLSDMEQAKLLDEQSLYITYLKEQNPAAVYGTLSELPGTYSWGRDASGFYMRVNINIQNNGNQTVQGSDYYLAVDIQRRSKAFGYSNIKTCEGVDLAPGERHVFVINDPAMYKYANQRDVTWTCSINFRNATAVDALLKYCKFTGEEYGQFLEVKEGMEIRMNSQQAMAIAEKVGHIDLYEQPSADSQVMGTAYHRQPIYVVDEDETDEWAKAYDLVEMDKYKFLGNVRRSDFEYSDRSELLPLYLSDGVAQGEDGGGVPVYKEADAESKVVKTLKSGTKVQYEYDFASQMNIIYEADGKGGYKVAGYVPMELIQFESTEMETP